MYKLGQVIVSEGGRNSLISKGIAKFTGSWATHGFMITGRSEAVEATVPCIKSFNYRERLNQFREDDRAWVVLDMPRPTLERRRRLAAKARSFEGKFYDLGQIGLWVATHMLEGRGRFVGDGPGTIVCSRLATAAFALELDESLFPDNVLSEKWPHDYYRLDNLRAGMVTPSDLLRSSLTVVEFNPSSAIRTFEDFLPTL